MPACKRIQSISDDFRIVIFAIFAMEGGGGRPLQMLAAVKPIYTAVLLARCA